jgi:uncharacterized protein with HEPN domain
MHRQDEVRIKHMLDAATEAVAFSKGASRKQLESDRMLSLSLVRLLEVIGEAAQGVSQEGRQANQNIPWEQMVGMRNRLIHGYFDIDLDIVWQTVTQDLPALIARLKDR